MTAATAAEDSGATPIDPLGNDTDVDGGPNRRLATQPAHGTPFTGAGDRVTYTPNADYCTRPPDHTSPTSPDPGGSDRDHPGDRHRVRRRPGRSR